MGMLTSEDLNMSAEEFSTRIPGPGSYWYNVYAREAPELLAAAEAIRKSAADEDRGAVYQRPDNYSEQTAEERRYDELLQRGVIDEQGNILRPDGLNPTEIMRGDAPSWASPELIKNAYIQAFESKSRGGQNFMDSGDYQNFLNAGYSLTQDQMDALSGVQGQGNQNDLTFGGGQPNTGVAQPTPAAGNPAFDPREEPTGGQADPRAVADVSGNAFMDAYSGSSGNQPQNPNVPADGPTQPTQSTPFADAYMRAKQAAEARGPVSSLFADALG